MGLLRPISTSDPALSRVAALVVLVFVLAVHVIGCSVPRGGPVGGAAAVAAELGVGDAVTECEPDAPVVVAFGARLASPSAPCPTPGVVPVPEPPFVVAAQVSPPRVLHQAAGSNVGRAVLLRHEVFLS